MICKADAIRDGLPYCSSHGCSKPGIFKLDTVNAVKPALGLPPRPVAPSSRISPPEPVAAPAKGAIAVGWLWVSTFIKICAAWLLYLYT